MKILALEPYYGGSHRAFLDGWMSQSRHEWSIHGLPDYKWKWRMRHAAITFSEAVNRRFDQGQDWDAVFCSDMLNLAEFRGLVRPEIARLPTVIYFHENQLTYPVRDEHERDTHFAFTNLVSALAADRVWFNSSFHRDSFHKAMRDFLRRMPDYAPTGSLDSIEAKSVVQHPGVASISRRDERKPGPLRILWAARWEHDKNPETFFSAMELLKSSRVDFRISVIGEQFRDSPPVFSKMREALSERIDRWGFQETRDDYLVALREADVFVSTAIHEFFGIAAVEAISAGAYPLLPERLAYPEILDLRHNPQFREAFYYDGTVTMLAKRLEQLSTQEITSHLLSEKLAGCLEVVQRFRWPARAAEMDDVIASLVAHTCNTNHNDLRPKM